MSLLMDALKKAEKKPSSSEIAKEPADLSSSPSSIEISNEEFSDFDSSAATSPAPTSSDSHEEVAPLSFVLEENEAAPSLEEEPVLTEVAAQRMLAATKKQHNSSLKIKWLLGVGLISILLIAGGYYYYHDFVEPSTLSQVYPRRQPVLSTTRPLAVESVETAEVAAAAPTQVLEPTAVAKDNIIAPLVSAAKEAVNTINTNTTALLSQENKAPPPPTLAKAAEVEIESTAAVLQTNGIKITRHVQTKSNQQINAAYKAFQSSQFKRAETLYKRVLKEDKTSRDALLGLAAIAMHKGELKAARQYYEKVLKNYPRDTLAQTGVISTLTHTNMTELERQLKLLASRSKKADYVYFNLGNLYARQQRWLLAQEAYYQAYSHNHQHATYLYNLAVSLDKLGKPVPALQFYTQALKYAAQQPIRFNKAKVKQRITELSAVTSPSALSRLNATP